MTAEPTTGMRSRVVVDVETTGLDPRIHEVIEVAWMVDGSLVRTYRPAHTLQYASPEALRVNRYFERGFRTAGMVAHPDEIGWLERDLVSDLTGATLVCANPSFDVPFLTGLIGFAPWHYRPIDIEALAYQEFPEFGEMPGLAKVAAFLSTKGWEIPDPDHSAGNDCLATWACYLALMQHRAGRVH